MPQITSQTTQEQGISVQIKLEPMKIYPTMDSLQSVVDLAYSQMPSIPQNVVFGILMSYHNTLLSLQQKQTYQD